MLKNYICVLVQARKCVCVCVHGRVVVVCVCVCKWRRGWYRTGALKEPLWLFVSLLIRFRVCICTCVLVCAVAYTCVFMGKLCLFHTLILWLTWFSTIPPNSSMVLDFFLGVFDRIQTFIAFKLIFQDKENIHVCYFCPIL